MRRSVGAGLSSLTVFLTSVPAGSVQAGVLDALFGGASSSQESTKAASNRRSWTLRDFTYVRLVPRETGSIPSEHPLRVDVETLRQLLAQLRIESRKDGQPLFAAEELAELAEPLAQALANASADDDVLLLSSSRRGEILTQPLAVTARLFVQAGSLQIVVHDTRFEFFNKYRGSGQPPEFRFGSRIQASDAKIQAVSGTSHRGDWVALPLGGVSGTAGAAAPAATKATVAPAHASTAASPAQSPAAHPLAAHSPRVRDAAFAEELEQRLVTLKRLRDKGLISEEEYQQKRKELLQLL